MHKCQALVGTTTCVKLEAPFRHTLLLKNVWARACTRFGYVPAPDSGTTWCTQFETRFTHAHMHKYKFVHKSMAHGCVTNVSSTFKHLPVHAYWHEVYVHAPQFYMHFSGTFCHNKVHEKFGHPKSSRSQGIGAVPTCFLVAT